MRIIIAGVKLRVASIDFRVMLKTQRFFRRPSASLVVLFVQRNQTLDNVAEFIDAMAGVLECLLPLCGDCVQLCRSLRLSSFG
jgi:hypothetical protein